MDLPKAGLRIGVVYPQIELAGDPGAVRRFGRAVEDLGSRRRSTAGARRAGRMSRWSLWASA
jgi:hypothetical protein